MRALLLLACLLGPSACAPQGGSQCSSTAPPCTASSNAGAVVVRWRIQDLQNGRLFPRGQCCCAPCSLSGQAGTDCGNNGQTGSGCPPTGAWYIDQVQLTAREVGGTHRQFCFSTSCPEAELTTQFCLPAQPTGDGGSSEGAAYDLQLTASVKRVVGSGAGMVFAAPIPAIAPPALRRTVQPGQIVNLDAVVLGVNPPATFFDGGFTDGGAAYDAGGQCY